MTKIATDVASKLAVAFVAAAMVVSAFAPAAQAQTTEELQQMINDLLAQVAELQAGVGQGSTSVASGVCPYTWTRDLSQGSTGADVMKLQQFLNADADTRVAAEGAGSVGMETEYYGPATAAAVSKMQVKYRAEVLSPAGLVNPTGYFGPSSRAKANSVCVAAPVTPDEEEEGEMTEEEEEEMDVTLSGEASLDNTDLEDGESSIEEGDTDVAIGEFIVEFTDGDAEISRIDLSLVVSSGNDGDDDAYDVFDTISLWVDGDKIAEMDATDEDEYLDEDAGTIRFTDLGLIAMEDEEVTVVVAASVQNSVDGAANGEEWNLDVTSLRFFDADGVASTETITVDAVSFDIEEAGSDESLDISLASSNPDSTDIIVDTDNDTNDVTIMVAELEAQDNDIELNTIVVKVDTVGASTTKVVDDIRVVIGDEEFSAESVSSSNKGTISQSQSRYVDNDVSDDSVWYVFDIDGDVTIDEDDMVDMEVVVDFNDTDDGARYANGTTIQASVQSVETAAWDATGADDLDASQFDGTAVGDAHVLVADGIVVPVDGFSATEDTLGQNDTIGEFTLEFEVTAVEDDFYITEFASTSATNNGVEFEVTGGTATVSASMVSTGDEDTSGVFTVREGETETFTLTVTVDPASTGTFRVTLKEIWYSSATDGLVNGGVGDTEGVYVPTPVSDFRSASQAIQGS